jgi:PAS domain S-box-containing protein
MSFISYSRLVYNANVALSLKQPARKDKSSAKNAELTLRNLTGRFDFFVNQAMAIITIIDKKGTILYQSPSIKNILGYDHTKRIGKNFLHSRLVHPNDVVIKEELQRMAFSHPNKNFKNELRMLHKNGSWSWMEVIFNNQLNNPDIAGIIVVTHDITERKVSEIQKDEFLSIASHELKTPLTTIRAYSQLLKKRMEKDTSKKEERIFLDKIVVQTDKIGHLINELLDVSKIQESKLTVAIKPIQLDELVKKIIGDFRYIAKKHRIELRVHTHCKVLGDENRIGQVVNNLLTNAIKYSPGSDTILVSIKKSNGTVVTSVTDYGVGIPDNLQKFVFQRFFRIEESNAQLISSGLGLYIASEIIKLHHGKLWLKSKVGKGSTFSFSLPEAERLKTQSV